jgi:hypothetical protein
MTRTLSEEEIRATAHFLANQTPTSNPVTR